MQKYSREIVADVLAANDIVDVIGSHLELKPGGTGRYKGLCPFHGEKTPSFTVSRDRQQFYCFGCQKHGDAIGFICEFEGLTFIEALRKLADRAGIRLPALSEKDNKEDYQRTQLIELGKFAASFFKGFLNDPLKGSACRQYLKSRELKPETIRRFEFGYAPDGWNGLVDKARAAEFKDAVLEASGLARRGQSGSMYDFFRNRLMIPIRDVNGNVVAFGGRDLGDGTPKYINSPENALYKKSRVLYGLYEARDAMHREKRVILVEGYFDLIRCFDAGIENVVAQCGTALTPEHAALIHRRVREVVVVYDSDAAGIRAAIRSVGLLTNAGLTVRAMTLPSGKDPDDFIKAHGAEAFRQLIDEALDGITYYIRKSADRTQTIEGRSAVAHEVFAILEGITDALRRDEYLKRTANELGLNEWTLRSEFAAFCRDRASRTPRQESEPPRPPAVRPDDREFVAALLESERFRRETQNELASVALAPGPLADVLQALFDNPGLDLSQRLDTDEARSLYAAAATSHDIPPEKVEELVKKRIARLKRDSLDAEAIRVQQALKDAERAGDQSRVVELLRLKITISRKIEEVGAT